MRPRASGSGAGHAMTRKPLVVRIPRTVVVSRNGRLRFLVLTAEEGEGHFRAAGALAAELSAEAGGEVVVRDAYKGDFGRLIPFFSRDAYHFQVRWLPWSYWLEYVLFAK